MALVAGLMLAAPMAEALTPVEARSGNPSGAASDGRAGTGPATAVPARMLSAVSATVVDGRTQITLRGDGRLEPASVEFAHDLPPRLVIDLPAVGASVPAVTRVGRHDVQKIRVGTNRVSPLVTRVVVDLSQRLGFRVTRSGPGGNDVAIVLDAGPAEATVGPTESDAPASGAPAAVLSAVETAVVAGQVRITLRGDRWLAPGSIEYARDAPPRLVIDLPGVGSAVPRMTRVGHHDVERIRVGTNSVSPLMTRVVVDLSHRVPFRVTRGSGRSGDLVVLLGGAATETPPGAPPPAPARATPATVLDSVEAAVVDGSARVTLRGNGRIRPLALEVAPDLPPRLVVDLAGVSSSAPAVTRVGRAGVEQIRVGAHSLSPLVTRVVVDLSRWMPYEATSGGDRGQDLVIVLGAVPGGTSGRAAPAAGVPAGAAGEPARAAEPPAATVIAAAPLATTEPTAPGRSEPPDASEWPSATQETAPSQGPPPWMRSMPRGPGQEAPAIPPAWPAEADAASSSGARLFALRSFRMALGVGYDLVGSEVRDGYSVSYDDSLTSPLATLQGSFSVIDPGILVVDAIADLRFDWRDYRSDALETDTYDNLESYRLNLSLLSGRGAPLRLYFERADFFMDQRQNSTLTGDLLARSQSGRRSTRGFSWEVNAARLPHLAATGYITQRRETGTFLGGWDTDDRQERLDLRVDKEHRRLRYDIGYSHEKSRLAYPLAQLATDYGVDVVRATTFVTPASDLTFNVGGRLTRFTFDQAGDLRRQRDFAGAGGDAGVEWRWSPRWRFSAHYGASTNESEVALSQTASPGVPDEADGAGIAVRRQFLFQDFDGRVTYASPGGSTVAAAFVRGLSLDPVPFGAPTLDALQMAGGQIDVTHSVATFELTVGGEGAVGRSSSNRGDTEPYREVAGRLRASKRVGDVTVSGHGGIRDTTGSYFYPIGGQSWYGGLEFLLDASRQLQLRASASRSYLLRDVVFQKGDDHTEAYGAAVSGPWYNVTFDYADTRSTTTGLLETALLNEWRPDELLASRPELFGFLYASRQLRRGLDARVTALRGLDFFARGRLDRLEFPAVGGTDPLAQKAAQVGAILGVRELQVEIGWEYLDYWSQIVATINRRFYVRVRRDLPLR